jgi:hypothetical protein
MSDNFLYADAVRKMSLTRPGYKADGAGNDDVKV